MAASLLSVHASKSIIPYVFVYFVACTFYEKRVREAKAKEAARVKANGAKANGGKTNGGRQPNGQANGGKNTSKWLSHTACLHWSFKERILFSCMLNIACEGESLPLRDVITKLLEKWMIGYTWGHKFRTAIVGWYKKSFKTGTPMTWIFFRYNSHYHSKMGEKRSWCIVRYQIWWRRQRI